MDLVTQTIGTNIYMAPEMIRGDHYNGKVDVYSFGIMMYEVITDLTPYPLFQSGKMKIFQLLQKIVNEKYRPEFKGPVKDYLKELIVKCWADDPKERPTFDEIYKKLSFNMEESVYDVFEDDTEYKFYLDDVDSDEVLSYVYDINENEQMNSPNSFIKEIKNSIDSLQNQLNEQIQKVAELTTENEEIKSQSIEQKNTIKTLLNENQQMRADINNQDKKINDLLNENQQMKIQIDELKKQFIRKPIETSSIEHESAFFAEHPIDPSTKAPIEKEASESPINTTIKAPIIKTTVEPAKKKQFAKFLAKTPSSPIQTNPGVFTFTPFNPETDGIFSYLTKKEGKNIHDSGIIEVTTNSLFSFRYHPKNLLNFGKNIYKANQTKSVMIIFDFKQIKIDITGYAIKTAKGFPKQGQPKSWKLEISNDGVNWDIIDEISNCEKLNNPDTIQLFFNVKKKYFARYCRFNHADNCWMDTSNYLLRFKGIDFFGNAKI